MYSSTPSDASTKNSGNPVKNLVHNILSYDSNIMLAAIISLLLVILFVLLLHVYAKWFLVRARQRSRRSVSIPQVLGARFHHFHSFTIDTAFDVSPTKGLESSVISSIPLFVFKGDEHKHGLIDCAICLSAFEDEEKGRRLPGCSHAFHVECIDMWLHSHSTCPICRCPLMLEDHKTTELNLFREHEVVGGEISEATMLNELEMSEDQSSRLEIIVEVPNSENENGGTNAHLFVGDSLKRIMSRSRSEGKVHPSAGVDESDF